MTRPEADPGRELLIGLMGRRDEPGGWTRNSYSSILSHPGSAGVPTGSLRVRTRALPGLDFWEFLEGGRAPAFFAPTGRGLCPSDRA